jgi:hypothetical protein
MVNGKHENTIEYPAPSVNDDKERLLPSGSRLIGNRQQPAIFHTASPLKANEKLLK